MSPETRKAYDAMLAALRAAERILDNFGQTYTLGVVRAAIALGEGH